MPRLRSVSFDRYKAFASHQTLEVRPITLLFGRNSVGKSAALRLLPILAHAVGHEGANAAIPTVLNYQSPALRSAAFTDLINKSARSSNIAFSLDWGEMKYAFEILGFRSPQSEFIANFHLETEEGTLRASLVDPATKAYAFDSEPTGPTEAIDFAGLMPSSLPTGQTAASLAHLNRTLLEFRASVHWIAAVRAQPPRRFALEPGVAHGVNYDGSGTAEALRVSSIRGDGVVNAVSAWLTRACGCELSFAATDGQVVFEREWFPFDVRPVGSGASLAVLDVGEGISQALPVVTLCHQARLGLLGENPILALEQPELHLHPRAGALLANEICDCVEAGSPASHLIETHSENFLLAIQIAVLEKRLSKDQVLVYWVEPSSEGANLIRIEFDDDGYPSFGWPEGVFREALEQARRISELRLAE